MCLALQQLAGHGASLWLAAHFGILDIRLLGDALQFEKITTKVKYFISNLANHNYQKKQKLANAIPVVFFNA